MKTVKPNIYFVVVVGDDLLDGCHAHETYAGALNMANPDGEWKAYLVAAKDAGEARLVPARLTDLQRMNANWAANHMKELTK